MTSTRQDYALIRPRHIREAMQHVLKESGLRVGLAVGMDIVLSGREFLTALGELPDRIDAILETTTLNAEQKKSVRGALPDFEAAKALMEEGGASAQAVRQLEEIDLDMRAKL